jgi:hypothetical protein
MESRQTGTGRLPEVGRHDRGQQWLATAASLAVGVAFFALWLFPSWLGFRVDTVGAARWQRIAAAPSVRQVRPSERHERTGAYAASLFRGLFRESRRGRNPAYLSRCARLALILTLKFARLGSRIAFSASRRSILLGALVKKCGVRLCLPSSYCRHET